MFVEEAIKVVTCRWCGYNALYSFWSKAVTREFRVVWVRGGRMGGRSEPDCRRQVGTVEVCPAGEIRSWLQTSQSHSNDLVGSGCQEQEYRLASWRRSKRTGIPQARRCQMNGRRPSGSNMAHLHQRSSSAAGRSRNGQAGRQSWPKESSAKTHKFLVAVGKLLAAAHRSIDGDGHVSSVQLRVAADRVDGRGLASRGE